MSPEARFFERIVRTHYWRKMPEIVERITFGNRTFFSKYLRIDAPIDDNLVRRHLEGEIVAAHSLADDEGNVTQLLIDYNGDDPRRFRHHALKMLAQEGFDDVSVFRSASPSHLHLYVFVEKQPLQSAIETGKIISEKLEAKLAKQWRIFPTDSLPEAYNIANLPYEPFS